MVERPDSTYPVVIKPYKLDLTQFGEKVRDEVSFRITNVSDQPLKPSMVVWADEYFEVELPESIDPGDFGKARLKLKESAHGSEFEKSFTISFNDATESRFTVPVKRKLRPRRQTAQKTGSTTDSSKTEGGGR